MEKTRYFLVPEKLWNMDTFELGNDLRKDPLLIEIPNFFYYGEETKIDLEDYGEEVLTQLLQQLKNQNSELHDVIAKIREKQMPRALFCKVDNSWSDEKIVQTMVYGDDGDCSIIEGYYYVGKITHNVGKNAVYINVFTC